MATAKLINCPKCGASVEAASAVPGSAIECTYCGSSIAIQAPAPPPPQPIPQIHVVVAAPGANVRPGHAGGAVAVSLVAGIVVALIGGVVAFTTLRGAGVAPKVPGVSALAGPTKPPVTCPVNGTVTIEDQDVELDETAIKASVNCKIFVRRSKIRAPSVIEAGTNAELVIEDSTLIAEQVAIDTGPNAKVKITGKSVIKSEETAIKANMNSELRLDGAEIESDDVAIEGSVNVRVDARGSKITGKTALSFSMNADVTLRDTTLKGEKKLGMNGKLKEK